MQYDLGKGLTNLIKVTQNVVNLVYLLFAFIYHLIRTQGTILSNHKTYRKGKKKYNL